MRETHLITKGVDGDTESPCKTEIPNLQFPSSVDEEILRLEITVQDSIIVTECDSLDISSLSKVPCIQVTHIEQLICKVLNGVQVQCASISVDIHIFL